MGEKHKWADVIIAIANGQVGQFKSEDGNWIDGIAFNPLNQIDLEWRIKPRTIMIGDMEVPDPLREAPDVGTEYWIACADSHQLNAVSRWTGEDVDLLWLKRSLVHLTREAAITHAKALIKVSGGTV